MTKTLMTYFATCPHIAELSFGTLPPGMGTGLFEGGIQKVEQDILGRNRITRTYILRHRDTPDSTWAQQVSLWVLEHPPEAMTVVPEGGTMVAPTKDGWATWELELIVS